MVLRGAPPPPPSVLFSPVPSRWQDLPPISARQDELEYDKCYALFLRSYIDREDVHPRVLDDGREEPPKIRDPERYLASWTHVTWKGAPRPASQPPPRPPLRTPAAGTALRRP